MNLSDLKNILKPWIWEITPRWVFSTEAIESLNFDGDLFSTTAKTVIDLSSEFGIPSGVKAVSVRLAARDSNSSSYATLYALLAPNNTAGYASVIARMNQSPNNSYAEAAGIVPCNADGDIYYQILASGTDTMQVVLQIWGYCL